MQKSQFGDMYYIKFNGKENRPIIGIIGNNGSINILQEGAPAVFVTLFGGNFYGSHKERDIVHMPPLAISSFRRYLLNATSSSRNTHFKQTDYFKNFNRYYDIQFNAVRMHAFRNENPENIQRIESKQQLTTILESITSTSFLDEPMTPEFQKIIHQIYDTVHYRNLSPFPSVLNSPL